MWPNEAGSGAPGRVIGFSVSGSVCAPPKRHLSPDGQLYLPEQQQARTGTSQRKKRQKNGVRRQKRATTNETSGAFQPRALQGEANEKTTNVWRRTTRMQET